MLRVFASSILAVMLVNVTVAQVSYEQALHTVGDHYAASIGNSLQGVWNGQGYCISPAGCPKDAPTFPGNNGLGL